MEPDDESEADSALSRAVHELNARLIELHRPLRVLESLRWPEQVRQDFLAKDGSEQPRIDPTTYPDVPLSFDPIRHMEACDDFRRHVRRKLGKSAVGELFLGRSLEMRRTAELLASRGRPNFVHLSRELFGTIVDRPDLRRDLTILVDRLDASTSEERDPLPSLSAANACAELHRRLAAVFPERPIRVELHDRLSAQAAAGGFGLRIRRDAVFTPWEVRLLEVHEGWVHLGTTLNGRTQPYLTALSRVVPGATEAQEGLAVLVEFLAGVASPQRCRRLATRLRAAMLAEDGADFRTVWRFCRERGLSPLDSWYQSVRLFRGSLPDGLGPFTKDLCYGLGLLYVLNAPAEDLRLLCLGKVGRRELPLLRVLLAEGWLQPPTFVPPPFAMTNQPTDPRCELCRRFCPTSHRAAG